jgi:hypothetical protein
VGLFCPSNPALCLETPRGCIFVGSFLGVLYVLFCLNKSLQVAMTKFEPGLLPKHSGPLELPVSHMVFLRRLAVIAHHDGRCWSVRRVHDRHVAVFCCFLLGLRSCAGATALHPRPPTSTLTACAIAVNPRVEGDRFPTSKRRVLLKSSGPRGGFTGAGGPGVTSTKFRLACSQQEARREPCRFA